jgi:O-acetyl-ADP-ribose deacetylase (regulator of RNase III)
MQLGGATSAKDLRSSTAIALKIASEKKLKTIAFPAVGTGIAGFPVGECAEIMIEEAVKHLSGTTSIEKIHFVLFDEETRKIFDGIARKSPQAGAKDE